MADPRNVGGGCCSFARRVYGGGWVGLGFPGDRCVVGVRGFGFCGGFEMMCVSVLRGGGRGDAGGFGCAARVDCSR